LSYIGRSLTDEFKAIRMNLIPVSFDLRRTSFHLPGRPLLADPKDDVASPRSDPAGWSKSCISGIPVQGSSPEPGGGEMRAGTLPKISGKPSKRVRNRLTLKLGMLAAVLFLGSSLAQAVPPSSARPFRVVDKNGALVGYTVTENVVARQIGTEWVTFYVHTGLGIFDSNAIYVYYTTADCSGTRYIPHYSTFSEGTRVGPLLYYPADQQVMTPQSVRVVYGNGDPDGLCQATSNVSGVFGTAATVNVDSFGLQLPFKAVQ
jgi:hypothetical protein